MRFSQRARLFSEVEGQRVPDGVGRRRAVPQECQGLSWIQFVYDTNSSSFAVTSSMWLRAAK